jgi:hypothetical protein
MRPVAPEEIRASFVNCTAGEAQRLPLPRELSDLPWDDLDFLGWRDLGAPDRSYLIAELGNRIVGIAMRLTSTKRGFLHRSMCSLCFTSHPGTGVSLMAARKAGAAGREANSAGLYICSDLDCSLYVRGKKQPSGADRTAETLSVDEQVARMMSNLTEFLRKLGAVTALAR